jgi:hypothetical protein
MCPLEKWDNLTILGGKWNDITCSAELDYTGGSKRNELA